MREEDYREIKKNPQEFTQFIYLSDLLGEAIALNEEVDSFLELMKPHGIQDVARTGVAAVGCAD